MWVAKAVLASVLAGVAPMVSGAGGPPAQLGGNRLICDELTQRLATAGPKRNLRTISFLLFEAAERGCIALAERLLEEGAAIGARDRAGNTALLRAARMGETEMVELLLARGADLAHRNLEGSTALLRAVEMNRRQTVRRLLAAGADAGAANAKGIAPVIVAAYNGNEALVRMLLDAGADPGVRDASGKGAITYAAGRGYRRIVAMLLDAGVEPDERYAHDLTALMWAAGHSNDVPVAEGLETLALLLERGARLDLVDDRGRSALMIAAERGHAEIATALVAAGADPGLRDRQGKTAAALAANDAVAAALAPRH